MYLRQSKSLSYKKGWGRRIDLERNRLSYLRILYSILLSKLIDEDIHADKYRWGKLLPKVLNCRSWMKRGISWEIFSHKYSGAVSIIWAISFQENYLVASLNNRLNSDTFIEFLKMIEYWINSNNQIEETKVMILLDNWSINRSKQ